MEEIDYDEIDILEKNKDVETLIIRLNHASPIIREDSILALGRIGDSKTIEPLIKLLND